jgi:heat shock protein HslJ
MSFSKLSVLAFFIVLILGCAPNNSNHSSNLPAGNDTINSHAAEHQDTSTLHLDSLNKPNTTSMIDGKWLLKSLDKKEFASMKEVFIDLNTSEKRFIGCNGCNNMFGSIGYDMKERFLEFENIASTKMACEGDSEYTFMQAFGGKHTFQLNYAGTSLTFYKEGKTMEFVRPAVN